MNCSMVYCLKSEASFSYYTYVKNIAFLYNVNVVKAYDAISIT